MSFIFYECSSLKLLADILKWNTNNVINIVGIFGRCSSLKILPDISKWNIINVKYLGGIFLDIYSPPLTHIEFSNIQNKKLEGEDIKLIVGGMFGGYSSLFSLPDISKWNTNNIINMKGMFYGCKDSLNIPTKFK